MAVAGPCAPKAGATVGNVAAGASWVIFMDSLPAISGAPGTYAGTEAPSVQILKDVGLPHEVAPTYGIQEFDGDHGLGHVRLATESGVHPNTSHPFWASGFADVATVHNGQLTNYWIMRRRLERRGMEFQTENDTELIAVYLAYRMSEEASLEEALRSSLEDLDGTFSYLVATRDSIGYAKDKLAAKPMVKYEDDDLIAICSEEVGLNRLFPGRALDTVEPAPLTYGLWSRA